MKNRSNLWFAALMMGLGASSIVAQNAFSCATSPTVAKKDKKAWKKYWAEHVKVDAKTSARRPASLTDSVPDVNSPNPWGGTNQANWKPEAILANAVSKALNEAWSRPNVNDVLVAVPVKMLSSNFHPYPDGQTNASLNFGDTWSEKNPEMLASLILFSNGTETLRFRIAKSLTPTSTGIKIVYVQNGQKKTLSLNGTPEAGSGDLIVEWTPQTADLPSFGDLFQNRVAFVQPNGWAKADKNADWFPIDFRDVVRSNASMLATLPADWQKLGKGTLLDPELVSVQGQTGSAFAFQAMGGNFGSDINGEQYFPVGGTGIHNMYPGPSGNMTAVGNGNTLVMEHPPSHFKSAYICFDKRNVGDEQTNGVPSGGGWHEIGDPAETVINSLESGPAIFGYANGAPDLNPPSGGLAYGLTDVAVIRKLKPGSALITAAGPTTTREGYDNRGKFGPSGRNYHWFIFDQAHPICAMEWVHPCVPGPSNQLGFQCSP